MLKEADRVDDPTAQSFAAFLDEGRRRQDAAEARFAELQDGDLATLIYTSGTTGPPKGVMLTHHAVAWTAQTAAKVVVGDPDRDCMVSYLPLSHIAEQMFSVHLP
ncbi:MAG: AMP-binding protein, partial [Myxococcales bacterium]|nr:AMP-binding protein [Myxococcales bacterium]